MMIQLPDLSQFSSLVELARWQAEHNPQRSYFTYVPDGETTEIDLTFEQLDQRARALAVVLLSRACLGDRALLLYSSALEYMVGFYGCQYAGIIPVLANPPRPNASLESLIAVATDCGAALALTNESLYSSVMGQVNQSELKHLVWLATDHLPYPETDRTWQPPNVSRESLAFIIYTSGSTSIPKGAMHTQHSILNEIGLISERCRLTPESVFVAWTPLAHVAGIIWSLVNIFVGFRYFYLPTQLVIERPERWLRFMTKYRGTFSMAFNFALQLCMGRISPEEMTNFDLSAWQLCCIGGEKIRADIFDQFCRRFEPCGFKPNIFMPTYASTEVIGGSTTIWPDSYRTYRLDQEAVEQNLAVIATDSTKKVASHVGCGAPFQGKKVLIVDPNTLQVLKSGQIGEIWVESTNIAIGYWNKPVENEATFQAFTMDTHEGPFYRTGDLGCLFENDLIITGRLKEFIILHGKNHYSQDFELTIERCHPALVPGGVAAVSLTLEEEEQLAVACEVKPDVPDFNPALVIQAIRDAVAREHQQSVSLIALVKPGSIPRTPSGKLQRFKVREELIAGQLEMIWLDRIDNRPIRVNDPKPGHVPPTTPIERALASIWEGVLHQSSIGVTDNFFELGGDSLTGIQVLTQVKDVFQVEIPARSIFDTPTIKTLAQLIIENRRRI